MIEGQREGEGLARRRRRRRRGAQAWVFLLDGKYGANKTLVAAQQNYPLTRIVYRIVLGPTEGY